MLNLPAGDVAVTALRAALEARTTSGPLAVIPQTSRRVSADYRDRLIAAIAPDAPCPDRCDVILTTSGSTAKPKGVMHTWSAIDHAATHLHARLGGPGHWLCALPLHTSAGFMTVARAVIAGNASVAVESLGGAQTFTSEVFAAAAAHVPKGRAYTSLVPQMAQRLMADEVGIAALRRFDAVLLGGQAVPTTLLAALARAGITAVASYGMTETCGGCVYDGQALTEVDITIDSGVVRVTGPVVMLGYRGDAVAPWNVRNRTFLTRDIGSIGSDGRLSVHGRTDDIAQINAVNVSLSAVEEILRELGINAVVCVANDCVTAVVPAAIGPDETEAAHGRIRDTLAVRLDFRVVRDIPLTAAGKPDRVALAHMCEVST